MMNNTRQPQAARGGMTLAGGLSPVGSVQPAPRPAGTPTTPPQNVSNFSSGYGAERPVGDYRAQGPGWAVDDAQSLANAQHLQGRQAAYRQAHPDQFDAQGNPLWQRGPAAPAPVAGNTTFAGDPRTMVSRPGMTTLNGDPRSMVSPPPQSNVTGDPRSMVGRPANTVAGDPRSMVGQPPSVTGDPRSMVARPGVTLPGTPSVQATGNNFTLGGGLTPIGAPAGSPPPAGSTTNSPGGAATFGGGLTPGGQPSAPPVQQPPAQQPPAQQPPPAQPPPGLTAPPPGNTLPWGNIQTSLNNSNVPPVPGGTDLRNTMMEAQRAAYQQATAYLDPQFANQENQLRSQLTNQGIPQNSEAWNKAMDEFQRNKQFAYQQAESAAVQQGNAAQAQLYQQGLASNQNQFGQNLAGGQFVNAAQAQGAAQILQRMGIDINAQQLAEVINQNNFGNSLTLRQQGINEMLLQQQNPLQMYLAMTNGTQPQQPNFPQVPGANIGGTDIASIIAQALGQQNNVYNTQVGSQNANTSAYASIIAALLSDRRFKTNIRSIGNHVVGVPLYAYDYIWGEPGIGVMADELERVRPDAVFEVHGVKVVDYGRI
jgi:hypothetical protein